MRFLIWGGGGHGKVVADVVRAAGGSVAGFADADPAKLGEEVEPGGGRVILLEERLVEIVAARKLPEGVDAIALAIGDNRLRLERFEMLEGLNAPPLVHPTAVVSPSARLGRGTVVLPLAAINAEAVVGRAVIVNTGSVIEHDAVIDDGVHVAPRSVLGGGVRGGRRSWIGIGATVIQQVAIGAETRVGAGAVVIQDVGDGCTVAGVPAKSIVPRSTRAESG
jgi:sugar O-acyltransferase (sialic acid O-acetyltransferase NeuD family)